MLQAPEERNVLKDNIALLRSFDDLPDSSSINIWSLRDQQHSRQQHTITLLLKSQKSIGSRKSRKGLLAYVKGPGENLSAPDRSDPAHSCLLVSAADRVLSISASSEQAFLPPLKAGLPKE
jgi:hypothetical protein